MIRINGLAFALSAFLLLSLSEARMRADDGERIFQNTCSKCHRDGAPNAPSPATLRNMPWQSIVAALETGKMSAIGKGLSFADRTAVAKFLGTESTSVIPQSANCTGVPPSLSKTAATWNGFGIDPENTRFQRAQAAGLTGQDVPKLKLKWAFGFPGVTTAFGTPTVWGGRVFIGSADGSVYSLNAESGCIYWTFKASDGVRAAVIVSNDGRTAFIADLHGNIYAVDAGNGTSFWTVRVDDHPQAGITGTPILDGDRLYVPVSGGAEQVAAGDPMYACCKFRGSIVALDTRTGKQIWKTYTIAEAPKVIGKTEAGTEVWGPSGVSVWSTPTIDSGRHALYFGTGVNYTEPTTKTSDAIFSLDTRTGRILWSQQLLSRDAYNFGCLTEQKSNCPKNPGKDQDIGAPPILRSLPGASHLLILATKAGIVYGLDPSHGKVRWQTRISAGGPQGGVIWGSSSDDKLAYFSISDWDPSTPEAGGGVVAVDFATGSKVWAQAAPKPTCLQMKGCSAAQPGGTSVIPGAVFATSLDGHLRAYDTSDGRIIWDFDTLRDFQTVNGVPAHGGSMDGSGPTVAGGFVYATSGYSRFPVIAGNVLLAFSVEGR